MNGVQVSTDHIEAMLAAADRYGIFAFPGGGSFSFYHHGRRHCLCGADDLCAFGRILWEANAESVAGVSPVPRGARSRGPVRGLHRDFHFDPHHQRTPSPIETLKLCACYRYQSSGCDAWESSEAAAFVDALEHCAIVALPGYQDAPWEWSR